jgi:hypothetical protein
MPSDLHQMENLFNRLKRLHADIDLCAAIVQNPMVVTDDQLTEWVNDIAHPLSQSFGDIIADIVGFYLNLEECKWCGEKHPGGPEYCKDNKENTPCTIPS